MKRNIHDPDYKSKSQLKREAQDVQVLVTPLVNLNATRLAALPLPPHILAAIQAAKAMKQGALKRQLLYIGGLLREEEDLAALRKALAQQLK